MRPAVFPLLKRFLVFATHLLLCLALFGCATGPREKVIHTARMDTLHATPVMNLFRDRGTSATVWASAFMFGMPGLLISSSIAGKNNRRVMDNWTASGKVRNDAIVPIMTQRLQAALERSGKLTFPKTGPADLTVRFREIDFGMRHKGSKRYAVLMEAQVVFAKPGDDEFYEFGEELESTTALTVEEYGTRPDAFRQAVTEIADKFAALVAQDYEVPERPIAKR